MAESSAPSTYVPSDAQPSQGTVMSEREQTARLLIAAVRDLSRARSYERVAEIVKVCARRLVDSDGATFVLRDGDMCFYLDEDAISPLWKGQRFPMSTCVGGWVMLHKEQCVIEDVFDDPRVPVAAYRPTFVRSLAVTPVRATEPIATIGTYWARHHRPSAWELSVLQDLADATAVAMENVEVYRELERRVQQRTESLSAVNRELEAFSYSVAHDLRNPLSAITGFAAVLEDHAGSASKEQLRMFAHEISAASTQMNALIESLLDLARCAAAPLARTQVDVAALAEDILAQIRTRRDQAHESLPVELDVEPGLLAHADPELLRVLLTNLLENAVKYSGKKPVVRIAIGRDGDAYFVRDQGAGFDPSQSARLFVPFQRLHSAREFKGTGVGLATCARVVHRHGGRIWAEGKPGEGATFYFTLPEP